MNKIEINNLTLAQLEEIEAQIKKQKESLTTGRKRVKEWEAYYTIYANWKLVYALDVTEEDKDRFNMWNYYLTRELAEQARDRQLAIVRVNDAIDRLNWDWEYQLWDLYYTIKLDYFINEFTPEIIQHIRPTCISKIKLKKIAEKIIEECGDDLKIIFNIK